MPAPGHIGTYFYMNSTRIPFHYGEKYIEVSGFVLK
jgi:hypothetical protein